MVLKRILATALGALGLGALAAGTASAQQIPAPDIFNDQITCSMNVPSSMNTPMPSVVPMGSMESPLDTLIGDGMTAIDTTATTGTFPDLGYVIPADGTNCGLGMDSNPFVATGMNAAGEDAEGAIPFDVADGYTKLLEQFMVVYGNPGDATSTGAKGVLDAANEALAMGIAMGTMGAALEALEEAVTRADDAYMKALAAFNAISTDPDNPDSLGPIYDAGKAEWMAKAIVTKAVVDYNSQVAGTNTAQTNLDGMYYADTYVDGATPADANSLWVPLGNTELFAGGTPVVTIAMGMGTVNVGQLVQYTNADLANPQVGMAAVPGMGDGSGSGTGNDAPVASDVTASNFDAAGNLIIPMEANTATADDLTDLRNTTSAASDATVSAIRTLVESANIAAAALKKARDENVGLNQAIYDEAYRRAQAEADYYNARWAEAQAYSRDTRTDAQKLEYLDTDGSGVNEAAERTEGNRNTGYVESPTSIASRNAALTEEQNKHFLREQELRAAVKAREEATAKVRAQFTDAQAFYDQLVARRTAVKAAADEVVADATSPSVTQTMAAENAAEALTEAQEKQAGILGLFDDDEDPTVNLINELLKGDDDGDDGQALVDAISSTYNTAKNAAQQATEGAQDIVDTLIGPDGQVTMNTAGIATNAENIATNAGNIMTNAGNIATNTANIATNTADIATNKANITTNAAGIMTNAGNIASNTAAIGMNTGAIADLGNRVGSNESAIMRNSGMISDLNESLEVVRAGVAASMALAGMPAINGRGVSIGVGSYDGESAFAVGFQIQGEMASFKVGVTSAGGETGASAGVGFQF